MSSIPTANFVRESAVIEAPLAKVWHLIKLGDFGNWNSSLSKTEVVKGASAETDVFKWTYKDGTVLEIKQEEHSALDHFITYSVISAQPALSYTSAVSTIRIYPITTGKHEGHTYVVWTGNFSSDATADVIEDAKYKRRDALADLAKHVGSG